MNETIIDRTYVCLKLIDMLYKKGLINEATYFNGNEPIRTSSFFALGCQGCQPSVHIIAD